MRRHSLALMVYLLACLPLVAAEPPDADVVLLRECKLPTDGPGLLAYLQKRFQSPPTDAHLKTLIEQLGDDSFVTRQAASRHLIDFGQRAKKHLEAALRHADLEIRHRAALCLREISDPNTSKILGSAIRVLSARKPAGAVKLLLDQVPSYHNDPLADTLQDALIALAVTDGKADPVLIAGLKDRDNHKRLFSALALCRAKATDQLPALRKLLDDTDKAIRVEVAMQLARLKQTDAIPLLLAEMDQPITPRYARVEELLVRLAGERSPYLADGDAATRTKYRKAWESWWKEHGPKVDLATIEEQEKLLGRTVVVMLDANEVIDLDSTGKERWKIDNIQMPLDIQPLPGDCVLLAEYKANRVTERNSKNEVVWTHKFDEVLMAQRLPNGHTFMANQSGIVQIDKAGNEVFTYSPIAGQQIMRARRLPNGEIILITSLGGPAHFVRLDRFGNRIRSFGVQVGTSGGRLDENERGEVMIPDNRNNRISVYDKDGNHVRDIVAQEPIAVTSIRGGGILYTSMSEKRAVEIDRTGKEVWEYKRDTRVTRAVRY